MHHERCNSIVKKVVDSQILHHSHAMICPDVSIPWSDDMRVNILNDPLGKSTALTTKQVINPGVAAHRQC